MLGQTSLADENTAIPLRDETGQAALPQDVASQRSSRFMWTVSQRSTGLMWTGLSFVVLMMIGLSVCERHPLASHASVEASRLVGPELAFIPITLPATALKPGLKHRPGLMPPRTNYVAAQRWARPQQTKIFMSPNDAVESNIASDGQDAELAKAQALKATAAKLRAEADAAQAAADAAAAAAAAVRGSLPAKPKASVSTSMSGYVLPGTKLRVEDWPEKPGKEWRFIKSDDPTLEPYGFNEETGKYTTLTPDRLVPSRRPGLYRQSARILFSMPGASDDLKLMRTLELLRSNADDNPVFGAVNVEFPYCANLIIEDLPFGKKGERLVVIDKGDLPAGLRRGDIVRGVSVPEREEKAWWQKVLETPAEESMVMLDKLGVSGYDAAMKENMKAVTESQGATKRKVVFVIERPGNQKIIEYLDSEY